MRSALIAALVLLSGAARTPAQEILQAVVLDLALVEIQVIVAGTRGDERLQCLVRSGPDHTRMVVERPVSDGFASGRTTVVSPPLPLLERGETEFAVVLVRQGTVLRARTGEPSSALCRRAGAESV